MNTVATKAILFLHPTRGRASDRTRSCGLQRKRLQATGAEEPERPGDVHSWHRYLRSVSEQRASLKQATPERHERYRRDLTLERLVTRVSTPRAGCIRLVARDHDEAVGGGADTDPSRRRALDRPPGRDVVNAHQHRRSQTSDDFHGFTRERDAKSVDPQIVRRVVGDRVDLVPADIRGDRERIPVEVRRSQTSASNVRIEPLSSGARRRQ